MSSERTETAFILCPCCSSDSQSLSQLTGISGWSHWSLERRVSIIACPHVEFLPYHIIIHACNESKNAGSWKAKQPAHMASPAIHMHAMTTWIKQKRGHERIEEGRKTAEPCSWEHNHGKASCEILNTSHAGSVIMPNKRSLPRMSSVQGLAPAFHLARHPVHDDVAGILTVMTSNRKTSSFHSVRCCRIQALSSFCLFLVFPCLSSLL